jgi:hypothetical protein
LQRFSPVKANQNAVMKPRAAIVKHSRPRKLGSPIFEKGIEEMALKTVLIESRQRDWFEANPEANTDFHFIARVYL